MRILKVKTRERRLGDLGERHAAKFLKKNGYKILKRNYVADGGEIDIIAEKDNILAFTEVKTRTVGKASADELRPASAVTPEKMRKIIKTAKIYYAFTERDKAMRLDIIEVLTDGKKILDINHMEGAFNANSATKRGR